MASLRIRRTRRHQTGRHGHVMVSFAVLLPVLVLVMGLVIEGGLMMATQVELQGLSDASARLAAIKTFQSDPDDPPDAGQAVEDYLAQMMPASAMPEFTLHRPPTRGRYAGDEGFIEVELVRHRNVAFGSLMGTGDQVTIRTHSVAGRLPVSSGARIIALRTNVRPGFRVAGNADIQVQGGIIVNSNGGGFDRYGFPVETGFDEVAAAVVGNARVMADDVQVFGGVNDPDSFEPLVADGPHPLRVRVPPIPDPLADRPVPTVALGAANVQQGQVRVTMGQVQVEGENQQLADGTVELHPGLYDSITITGGRVVFRPGIYVLRSSGPVSMSITGGDVWSTGGVLFYNTGTNFDVTTGLPDAGDSLDPDSPAAPGDFGEIQIYSNVRFDPFDVAGHPLAGLVIFQRRGNLRPVELRAQTQLSSMNGTIYAPRAELRVSGQGSFNCQAVVGSFNKTGTGMILLDCPHDPHLRAARVFRVD